MQTTNGQSTSKLTQAIAFLFYLIGGLLVFLWGANTFKLFPTNMNIVYEWGLTLILLLLAVVMQRVPRWQVYWKIASALFIASAANAVNLSLGNFLATDPPSYSERTCDSLPLISSHRRSPLF